MLPFTGRSGGPHQPDGSAQEDRYQRECAMSRNQKLILAACAAILVAGCTTPPALTAAQVAEKAKPDPRQGEEVRNICFTQQIRSWRALDRRSVIVESGGRNEYKLDLVGGCQPDDAFMSIGLISRVGGGSCLESGDKLVTDERFNSGACMIRKIYKWNKDAAKPEAPAAG
jgi:hypothetical protein